MTYQVFELTVDTSDPEDSFDLVGAMRYIVESMPEDATYRVTLRVPGDRTAIFVGSSADEG